MLHYSMNQQFRSFGILERKEASPEIKIKMASDASAAPRAASVRQTGYILKGARQSASEAYQLHLLIIPEDLDKPGPCSVYMSRNMLYAGLSIPYYFSSLFFPDVSLLQSSAVLSSWLFV